MFILIPLFVITLMFTFAVNRNIKAAFHRHNVQVSYSEGIELGPIGK